MNSRYVKSVGMGIAVIMLAVGFLTGCASNSKEAGSGSVAKPEEEVTLKIFTRFSDSSPASVAFRERLQQFMDENPHITVIDESTNDENAFDNKWKTFIAIGDLPDLFQNYGGAVVADYVNNGMFAELDSYFADDPAWKESFLDLFEIWQFDGKTYGVPYEFYAVALFYNKELVAGAGAEVPATIEQFMQVSSQLKAQGIVPMAAGLKDVFKGSHLFVSLFVKRFGVEGMKKLGDRTYAYDGPEVMEIFRLMDEMNKNGFLGDSIVGVDYNAEKAMFLNGETAMHYDGSWFISEAESSEIQDKIGVVSMPYFEQSASYKDALMGGAGGGFSLSGFIEGPRKDAAVQLLKFLTSKEHFEYIQKASQGGVYPVKIDANPEWIGPVTVEYSRTVADTKQFTPETYETEPEVISKWRQAMQGLFAGNSPEAAAKEIMDVVNRLAE